MVPLSECSPEIILKELVAHKNLKHENILKFRSSKIEFGQYYYATEPYLPVNIIDYIKKH